MTCIELDMLQTAGIGALALIVGMILTAEGCLYACILYQCRIPK